MGQIGMSFRVGQAAGAALPSGRQASDGARAAAKRGAGRGAEKSREAAAPKSRARVKPKDLAIFTRQLSVMIDAGLPLVQSLEILGAQQENKAFARMLIGVRSSVEGGSTLANALRQYPKPFDDLYTNMVEAGETGGILDTILKRLSTYIEKAVKLRRAVQSAMIYPAAVLTIAAGVILLLLWKVVPIFATLFAGMNVALPLPTRLVIALSHAVATFSWILIAAAGIAGYGLKRYYATRRGRLAIDGVILRIPVLGAVMRKISVARFTRTLGTLIASGVSMLEAMDITARGSGNAVIEAAIVRVRNAVEAGRTIVDPLRETAVFPNMVVQMIGVGEQTGALDAMLQKIGDFCEEEVDTAVADLLTALEPL